MLPLQHRIFFRINWLFFSTCLDVSKRINRKGQKRILFSLDCDWKDELTEAFTGTSIKVYFDDLVHARFDDYDLVVPLSIEDLTNADIQSRIIAKPSKIPVPSPKVVMLFHDKVCFNDFLMSNGFSQFVPKIKNHGEYPYILKKKEDKWGANSFMIQNEAAEMEHEDKSGSKDFFMQEAIPGKFEHTAHILFKDNRIEQAITFVYIFEKDYGIKGKDNCIRMIARNRFLKIFEEILETAEFEGICCVNYKIKDGQPYILEINPRVGASIVPFFYWFVKDRI